MSADCTLHHRVEIAALVERMQRERTPAMIEFGDSRAIVSSVLDVRRPTDALVFDVARDTEQNRHLFAAQSLAFTTELDHIAIRFATGAASLIALDDGPAAIVDLPAVVTRLQRREWFRAAVPAQSPLRCTLLDDQGRATSARAIDLSAGGAALLVDEGATAAPGSGHELILSIPEIGFLDLGVTLRTVGPATGPASGSAGKVRMGFRFESLPPRTASQLQRYVQQLEVRQARESKQRE